MHAERSPIPRPMNKDVESTQVSAHRQQEQCTDQHHALAVSDYSREILAASYVRLGHHSREIKEEYRLENKNYEAAADLTTKKTNTLSYLTTRASKMDACFRHLNDKAWSNSSL